MKKMNIRSKVAFSALFLSILSSALAITCQNEKKAEKKGYNLSLTSLEKFAEIKINDIELNTTIATMLEYNNYLMKMGSKVGLTEQDIAFIGTKKSNDSNIFSLKINEGEYRQLGKDEYYHVMENENNQIELVCDLGLGHDILTDQEASQNSKEIASLDEFMKEYELSPIGYTKSFPSWNEADEEFILTYYNEEILMCLEELGFPIEVYDVKDFLAAYQAKNQNKQLKRTTTTK